MVCSRKQITQNQLFFMVLCLYLAYCFTKIFFFCRHTATYMSFRFIYIENFSCLSRQVRIYLFKAVSDVFMYRTLTHPKLFRSLPDRRVVLNNIRGNVDCSFFDIILQYTLAKCVFYIVCGSLGFILTFQFIYTCFF